MHEDAEGGRHRLLPHQDSGDLELACSCWSSASTHGASVIGTQQCPRGVAGIHPKYLVQRHLAKVGQDVSQFAARGVETSSSKELYQWQQ